MEFTNTPPEEIKTKQIIAEKILQGKRLTQSERGYVYFLLTGEHEPVKRIKGRPPGSTKEERNIDLFIKHVDGADHNESGLGIDGYYSAIREGKKAFWGKLQSEKEKLNSHLLLLGYAKGDVSEDIQRTKDVLQSISELMSLLEDRGQIVRGRGWYCKKNTPK